MLHFFYLLFKAHFYLLTFFLSFSFWELICFHGRSIVKLHSILILTLPRVSLIRDFCAFSYMTEKCISSYFSVVAGRWEFKEKYGIGTYISAINKLLSFQEQFNTQIWKKKKKNQFTSLMPVLTVYLPPFFPKSKPTAENHLLVESWKISQEPFPPESKNLLLHKEIQIGVLCQRKSQ